MRCMGVDGSRCEGGAADTQGGVYTGGCIDANRGRSIIGGGLLLPLDGHKDVRLSLTPGLHPTPTSIPPWSTSRASEPRLMAKLSSSWTSWGLGLTPQVRSVGNGVGT